MKVFKLVLTGIAILVCALFMIGKSLNNAHRVQQNRSLRKKDSMDASTPNLQLMTNPLGMPIRMAY